MATFAININPDGSIKNTGGAVPECLACERTALGEYAVTGPECVAQEGWRVSIPSDDNGDRMCKVSFSDTESGVVVNVTDKTGAPMDIPDGRTLTVRFVAPEVEDL